MLRVFVPFALGYYFSYLVRNVNAVIAPDLTRELALDASSLGLLTSAYFFTFAAFQLPLGVLLDRYGPRRVEAALLMVAAAGSTLFAFSDSLPGLVSARALIGVGVSACLMASFKANTLWFSADKLPLANGCIMAAGGLGALSATAPVEALLGVTDWRGVFLAFAAFSALASVILYTVVPRRPEEHGDAARETLAVQVKGIVQVLTSAMFWRVVPISTMSQAAFLAIQGLWAGPWLADVAGLDRSEVANHLFIIAVAMTAGFLGLGAVATRLIRGGVAPLTVASAALCIFGAAQMALVLALPLPALLLWCVFGISGSSGILIYSYLAPQFPAALAGRVVTSLNLFAFAGAFAVQWGMGAILDRYPGALDGSYAGEGYRLAFGSVLALQAAALLWMWLRAPATRAAAG